jgi:hypothetical protein
MNIFYGTGTGIFLPFVFETVLTYSYVLMSIREYEPIIHKTYSLILISL